MRIPKVLKDAGKECQINKVTTAQGHNDLGSYMPFYDQINLLDAEIENIPEWALAEAFLHELLERVNALYDLRLRHHQICTISNNLFGIIRQNDLDFRGEQNVGTTNDDSN